MIINTKKVYNNKKTKKGEKIMSSENELKETAVEEETKAVEETTETVVEEKVEETKKGAVKKAKYGECETKSTLVEKKDVIAIVDKVLAQSTRLLANFTVRSAEARAMLNGIKDEVSKL